MEITNSSFAILSSSIAATLMLLVGSFDNVNKYAKFKKNVATKSLNSG